MNDYELSEGSINTNHLYNLASQEFRMEMLFPMLKELKETIELKPKIQEYVRIWMRKL